MVVENLDDIGAVFGKAFPQLVVVHEDEAQRALLVQRVEIEVVRKDERCFLDSCFMKKIHGLGAQFEILSGDRNERDTCGICQLCGFGFVPRVAYRGNHGIQVRRLVSHHDT